VRGALGARGPAGVPAVVARHHLTRIGDVGEEPGEEQLRVQGHCAGRGPVRREEREYAAAEGLAQGGAVVCRPAGPAHEGAVGPEAAVGDDEMQMGMPVGQRAVGLETGDDSDPEVRLPRGGADARGDDAGRQPREVAEEGTAVEAVGPERK